MPPFPPRPLSKTHPTTLWAPQFCTQTALADLSQIPHNQPRNDPYPTLLRYHTLHMSRH